MRDYRDYDPDDSFNVKSFLQVLRAISTILGVAAILTGLVFGVRMFVLILGALRDPEAFQPLLTKWATTVGGEELDIVISGNTYHCARVVAVIVLGAGSVVLAWISMGLMMAGAKVVSWMLGVLLAALVIPLIIMTYRSLKSSIRSAMWEDVRSGRVR
jgi:hypothetical protein